MATMTVTRKEKTTVPIILRKRYGIEEETTVDVEVTGSGMLLKKARSRLDLVGTDKRSQKKVFKLFDKMREEDER